MSGSHNVEELLGGLKAYAELPKSQMQTLDPIYYTSPEIFALEIEHIWKKEWVVVGHVCDVKNPGDFFAFDFLDEPMMVVRGEDMKIRALSTVCRHRFMPVVRHGERGNTSRFQCPYHRWTYGCDGGLKQALYMEENQGFDMQNVRLPEYRLEIWNDLIWINLDDHADPLAPRLTDLEERFSVFKAPGDWVNTTPYDETWPANWKLCNENSEAYHTMCIHTESLEPYVPTQNVQPGRDGEYWGVSEDLYAVEREVTQKMLERIDWKPGDMGQEQPALEIFIIGPANAFTMQPGGAGWYPYWPVSINETRAFQGQVCAPELAERGDPRDSGFYRVLNEDKSAFEEGIGRAVYSDKLDAGPMSFMEHAPFTMHQWYARKLVKAVGAL